MSQAAQTGTETWMDVPQAADYLGVSQDTLRRWVRDGMLHAHRVGRAMTFRQECLDAVVERFIGYAEERRLADRCTACGHMGLVDGTVHAMGKTYFHPDNTRFWTLQQSMVPMHARACPSCGHVQFYAVTEKLESLLPACERVEEPAPVCVG